MKVQSTYHSLPGIQSLYGQFTVTYQTSWMLRIVRVTNCRVRIVCVANCLLRIVGLPVETEPIQHVKLDANNI